MIRCEYCFLYFYVRLAKIKEWIDAKDPNATIIPFSGAFELKVYSFFLCCPLTYKPPTPFPHFSHMNYDGGINLIP